MELNSKKLEQTSKIIYYSISLLLCMFLILLSSRIIDDLDSTITAPLPQDFENKSVLAKLEQQLLKHTSDIENLSFKKSAIEKTILTAKANYNNEKQSFDNWLETRKTLGSPDKDQEVINRAKKLDGFYKIEQEWREQANTFHNKIDSVGKKQQDVQKLIMDEQNAAIKKYDQEYKYYELKVFLVRLLFVAPVLALGIFFFVRYRKHKFWPLYFGFTLFSFYAFFIGLVPYLPSYGGYIRYTVGILLSAGLGYYAIKRIRTFIEQKQAELKTSTQERAKKVETETAEKALNNHFCPSCGKDFMLKKWEFPLAKITEIEAYKYATHFCRHCGLELFRNCESCNHTNFVHLPFCASCGVDIAVK